MQNITAEKLMELLTETLSYMEIDIFSKSDEIIEHAIFEEFDIGIHSFFHQDSLERLYATGLIDREFKNKGAELRNLVVVMQKDNLWNLESFRRDDVWKKMVGLALELKSKCDSA